VTIIYVGNFRHDFCTESHIARTLEALQHVVIYVQEDETTPDQLTQLLAAGGFELFLFTRTWGHTVDESHLELLRKLGVPSVSYHLDLYAPLKRSVGLETDSFWRTDYVFTPDGDPRSAELFAAKGINHHFMWPAVYGPEAYLLDLPVVHDVIFVGSWRGYHPEWPYREQLVQWLNKSYGRRFEVWGPSDAEHLRSSRTSRASRSASNWARSS
jgi:hypothetical protein